MILFYSTIAFSLIFARLQYEDNTYSNFIRASWEVNLGSFSTAGYGQILYLSFFLYGLINPTILLNLLISIMSSTFDRVNTNVIVADSKELASMILEAELIYFWNRDKKSKEYLHVCAAKDLDGNQDYFAIGIKEIKNKIGVLGGNQVTVSENLGSIIESQKKINAENLSTKEILESLEKRQETTKEILERLEKRQENTEVILQNIMKLLNK